MIREEVERRTILKNLGMAIFSVPLLELLVLGQDQEPPVITARNSYLPGQWLYDPAGLYINKGQTVRWVSRKWGSTVAAFHPSNDNHELRIPENARPFYSGLLHENAQPAGSPLPPKSYTNTFEWTFDVEGTYDYYCRNHESLGMVGRIVVGSPGGPAEKNPPGYGGREGRAVMFPASKKLLAALPSEEIMAKKKIPYPSDLLVVPYPFSER
jgi:plastocyanin